MREREAEGERERERSINRVNVHVNMPTGDMVSFILNRKRGFEGK